MSYQLKGDTVFCSASEIPVAWRGDVLVAGGGPGGMGAAVSAARNGCRVLLIEGLGYLGGMAAFGAGMPMGGAWPGYRSIGGVAREFLDASANAGPDSAEVRDVKPFSLWYFHDSEHTKALAFRMIEEAGVDLLLHTMVVDVIRDEGAPGRLIGLVIESKSGRQAVLGKVVIDATGDADVAARAGADFVKGDENGAMMAVTIPYVLADVDVERVMAYRESDPTFERAIARAREDGLPLPEVDRLYAFRVGMRPNTLYCNNVRVPNIDGTDVWSLTRGEVEARRKVWMHVAFYRGYVPGCERAYIAKAGESLGIRDTRRILGEETLTTEDCVELRKRSDKILRCAGPIDEVARGNVPSSITALKDDQDWYDIPYGCIVPRGLDNVLVSGRSFSSSHLAQAGSRGIALLVGMGQAAGTAAAIIARDGVRARDVDVTRLQQIMKSQGADLGD